MKHFQILFFILFTGTIFSQSYLGFITKQVNFRAGPGSDYEIISSLKPGTQIFISSLEADDDFYKHCSTTTKELYQQHYSENIFITKFQE